ncbi:hypothetical protein GCM10009647_050980 [Streptomyces sanglieri]|uniref:LysE family translocator n=1 Tax=Streptomyces sanglieri TaxID=193460 RepID=A0ABW2WM78_9ACTN|nr:LysE family transporter [Streptomyces sp. Wh19]MDV9193863.1 LysE family transporter [Streptomyces sp. Wh19]
MKRNPRQASLSSGAGRRRRSGLVAGHAVYALVAVAGLVVIVASSPAALTALTVEGAAHLLRLGSGVLRQPAVPTAVGEGADASAAQVMLKGLAISGLNPNALLHFSLFPQFIRAGDGWPVAARTGLLSTVRTRPPAPLPDSPPASWPARFSNPSLGHPGRYPGQRCHGDCHRRPPAGGTPDRLRNPPASKWT